MKYYYLFLSVLFFATLVSCSSSKRNYTYHGPKKKISRENQIRQLSQPYDIRNEVVVRSLKHVGRPYRYGGKTPQSGFDCSGFISYIFSEAGVPLSGSSHEQATLGIKKDYEQLQAGDLIFFGSKDKISHVSMVLKNESGEMEVIHSTTSSGVRIDNVSKSSYWKGKFLFGRDILYPLEWASK
ncbi:MAG TPA: C40 family peptidase [Saprospiraceae bacterium]|nr:C40 family peptidase [Saprospiraceae bacterium]